VTSILTNHEAEQLLLDIRVARAAATAATAVPSAEPADRGGAFLAFPTSIVIAVPGRGHNVFPLRTTAEPGALCHDSGWSSLTGQVDGVSVDGRFGWTVMAGGGRADPIDSATYRFRAQGRSVARPDWADQLPRSQRLEPAGPASLARQQARLVRRGQTAECELLRRTARVFEQFCRGPLRRAIAVRPALEVSDVVQRAMQVASRLLPLYSSAARPPCSWLGMIQLDGRRDLHRAITQLDWLPRDLAEVVARMETATGIAPGDEPTVVLAAIIEAAVAHHQPIPRATPGQIQAALAAPQLVALDTRSAAVAATAAAHRALAALDRELEAADDRPGELTAAVGRLIGADPGLVARASVGDRQAIDTIGHGVIAALGQPGETHACTRQRFRREFQTAGRLFASADGLVCFGHRAPARHLAQLDANLAEQTGRRAS
jgi:hypothetical protein